MTSAAVNTRWEDVGARASVCSAGICGALLCEAELERTDILILRF